MSEMRFSDAIRLGSMACGPARYHTVDPHGNRCALGAALLAVGRKGVYLEAFDVWPAITNYMVEHPVTGRRMAVLSAVRELNDFHKWSREAIADWVETIERRADADQQALSTDALPTAVSA